MSALPTAWPSINSGVDARRFLGGVTDIVETKRDERNYLEIIIRIKSINDVVIAGGGKRGQRRITIENKVFLKFWQFTMLKLPQ